MLENSSRTTALNSTAHPFFGVCVCVIGVLFLTLYLHARLPTSSGGRGISMTLNSTPDCLKGCGPPLGMRYGAEGGGVPSIKRFMDTSAA